MPDLQGFLNLLEREKQLTRVRVEVDPEYEITEIATRVVKEQGPALLFEHVKGSNLPVAINFLGSHRRVELALGRHPQEVGNDLKRLMEAAMPPRPQKLIDEWRTIGRVLAASPYHKLKGPAQAVAETPDLRRLPILKCWPKDAGRFITFGMVFTQDPDTGARNVGIYRMQVKAPDQVMMHWQIAKGGGYHHWKAEQQRKALPVAVVIGADPILYICAVSPLPEGIDELAFAGFLRGSRVHLSPGKSGQMVPADAEIVLEGYVPPKERAQEGPFGDHFGHYSHPKPCPILRIQHMTHKSAPVYAAAVVGKPPQEDRYIGNAVQEMLLPMIRIIHPEIRDIWAYYEAGFHSLCVISAIQRFGKEGVKAAMGLLGTGQMALTKVVVVVDADVDARDFKAVLRALRANFDPSQDFLLLPGVPFDTLDFTSFTLNLGSKMILDATSQAAPQSTGGIPEVSDAQIKALHPRIRRSRLVEGALLAVCVEGEGRTVIEQLVKTPACAGIKAVAVVSEDVKLDDDESLLWGIFTRFDPARDVVFTQAELKGSWPVYRGVMGIDATFKTGYPDPVVMDERVIQLVDSRWNLYWKA